VFYFSEFKAYQADPHKTIARKVKPDHLSLRLIHFFDCKSTLACYFHEKKPDARKRFLT